MELGTPGNKASGTLKTLNCGDYNIFSDLFLICLKIIDIQS